MTGPNARRAANWIFTANTARKVGQLVYTCALNDAGGVESDLTVTPIASGSGALHDPTFKGDGFYIVAGGASANHTYAHIATACRELGIDVTLQDVTDRLGVLSVQGKRSKDILQSITDAELSDTALPLYASALLNIQTDAGPVAVRAMRVSFVGELGYELHVDADQCAALYAALRKAGEPHGLKDAGYRAFYALSNEKGYHLWNFDLRMDDTPLEANLGFVCRRDGNAYKGKVAIERQRAEGIRKRLVTFELDEQVPLWGLEGVYRDGISVGHVRRAEHAYSLAKMIAKAYVRRPDDGVVTSEFLQAGRYEIDVMGERHPVRLHLSSPFDPESKRLRGDYSN